MCIIYDEHGDAEADNVLLIRRWASGYLQQMMEDCCSNYPAQRAACYGWHGAGDSQLLPGTGGKDISQRWAADNTPPGALPSCAIPTESEAEYSSTRYKLHNYLASGLVFEELNWQQLGGAIIPPAPRFAIGYRINPG